MISLGHYSNLFAAHFLLLVCLAPAYAETKSGNSALNFTCVVWNPLPIPAVFYRHGESYLPLEFSPGKRSKPYPLKSGATALELFEMAENTGGEPSYKMVGKAPLVAGARQQLFLIDPVKKPAGLPLRLFGVNDALDAFPRGTFRFFNFSKEELQVKFGGKVSKLPAGEVCVIESNVSKDGGFIPFLIGDPKGNVVFETRMFSQPTGRDMVFIGAPAQPGGRFLVKVLPQLIPAEPAKPTGQ